VEARTAIAGAITMTITVSPARNEYTANAGQTIFNYTFKIFQNTDLNVYVTPAGQDANDSTDLTTLYTVTGIGDEDGGSITLAIPTNANDLVTIVSNIPSSRTTDYQNNGDFRPNVVNNDFDRVVSLVKKVEDRTNRALLLPESQQDPKPLSLPIPKSGFPVRWNGDETGLENYDNSTVSNEEIANDKVVINYPTLLAAQSDASLKINQSCNIKERTIGNGGGAFWDVVSGEIANGDTIVNHNSLPIQLKLRIGISTSIVEAGADKNNVTNSTSSVQSLLDSTGSARVGIGSFKMSTIALAFEQSIRGESYTKSILNFEDQGITFNNSYTELSNLHLLGTKSGGVINPETGNLGHVAITQQDDPNSGVSTMKGLRINGWDTGYSEITTTNIWTGAYRKITDSEFNNSKVGISAVGGATDLRVSNTDIRNCSVNGLYIECPLSSQYANIRLDQVLIEGCGATGSLTGKARQAGLYVGAYSQLSLDNGYLEATSICVDEKGSFKIDNSYKNNSVRIFGTGLIVIGGNYETYKLNISEDIDTGWTPGGCTVTQNPDVGKGGGSISVNSSADAFTSITSDYDQTIQQELTIGDGQEAFLFVQCQARTPTKPTGNWFGPLLRASFVDTASGTFNNNTDLDMDPLQVAAIGEDWAYVNYIIPIRFNAATGLNPAEYLKWIRLNFLFTDSGYTQSGDGAFEVQIKKVKAILYVPKF